MTAKVKQYTTQDIEKITDNWTQELQKAAQGKATSLFFAKHKILKIPPSEEKGLVAVVGGSNLIVAEIIRSNKLIEILTYEKRPLPTLKTKEILFELLASKIPESVSKVAINFAYPLSPVFENGRLDGILTAGTKEHDLQGLVGKQVGAEFVNYLEKKQNREIIVTVANDTICLVLAGLSKCESESLAGGIVGTGINFGLFLDESTLVNLESANFDKFRPTETGKQILEKSSNPSKGQYEKEVSGAYLYQHFNLIAQKIGLKSIESTSDLHKLAESSGIEAEIAQALFDRSASLTAAHIAGIYKFKSQSQLSLIMEGSLFWNGWNYRNLVYKYLRDLGINLNHLQVFKIERSYLLGAAELIL